MPSRVLTGVAVPLVVLLAGVFAMWWMEERPPDALFEEKAGCHRPASLTLLAPPANTVLTPNPCLSTWADLALAVTDLIPAPQRAQADGFLSVLTGLTKGLDDRKSSDCGYGRDKLALAIYHDQSSPSSVGLAFAFRSGTDVLQKLGPCQIAAPEPSMCLRSAPILDTARVAAIAWLGSSEAVCRDLNTRGGQLSADAPFAAVKDPAGAKVRTLPSTSSPQVGSFAPAAFMRLDCYVIGQEVNLGQRRWQLVVGQGYVYEGLLDVSRPAKLCAAPMATTVVTNDSARLRAAPSTASVGLVTVPRDTLGTAICYTTGTLVELHGASSARWLQMTIVETTGYMSDLLVEYGPEIPACAGGN